MRLIRWKKRFFTAKVTVISGKILERNFYHIAFLLFRDPAASLKADRWKLTAESTLSVLGDKFPVRAHPCYACLGFASRNRNGSEA